MKILFPLLLITIVTGCNHHSEKRGEITQEQLKEPLIRANKQMAESESEKIDRYIKRRGWEVIQTGTGLRYFIHQHGDGPQAKQGQVATVTYQISLLDGTVCYASEENKPKQFLIGQDNVESGLHEGMTYLHVGDEAVFILPSHLGHGLTGDQNKIPSRAVLIINIKLLALQ